MIGKSPYWSLVFSKSLFIPCELSIPDIILLKLSEAVETKWNSFWLKIGSKNMSYLFSFLAFTLQQKLDSVLNLGVDIF